MVPRFEKDLTEYCNSRHTIVVNSATSALHLACLALGLGPGDWLWTSPISFVASANCGLYCGAKVDFVDIDPQTYNLCPKLLEKKLIEAELTGQLPKIVIPVHLCGHPCDMQAIHTLALKYGFKIIEDASHAIGGKYQNESIGNCRHSDITVFSFHPVKIITTGEGGAALTNDAELAMRIELLRSHGITRDAAQMTHEPDGPWYYQQVDLGYNYRMTDLQAALGVSQLNRLDQYVMSRHALAEQYNERLADLPLTIPYQHSDGYSAYHLYVVRLQQAKCNLLSHRKVFESLREQGIGVNIHYIPIHTQPYYQRFGFKQGDFPQAESYYNEAISLPLYPTMTQAQMDKVVIALQKALRQ